MFKIKKENYKYWAVAFAIHFLYVLPIIIVNRPYMDDVTRTIKGYTGWNGDGRPLAELIIEIIGGASGNAIDVSPFPLIFAIFILSYSLTLFYQNSELINDKVSPIMVALFMFSFSVNPFLIFGFSYKFDVISMIFSLTLLLVLFSVQCNKWFWQLLLSFVLGMSMFVTYQASVGLAFALFLISVLSYLNENGSVKKVYLDSINILGICGSALIYKFVVSKFFISQDASDWRYKSSQMVKLTESGAITSLVKNMGRFVRYIVESFRTSMTITFTVAILFLVLLLHVVIVIRIGKISIKNCDKKKVFIFKIIVTALLPLIMFGSILAPLSFLVNTGVEPRLFFALSGLSMLVGVEAAIAAKDSKEAKIAGYTAVSVVSIWGFSLMNMYGNASYSQKQYETFLAYNIVSDMNEVLSEKMYAPKDLDYIQLSIVGNTPRSPQCYYLAEIYPFINEMVPVYIDNGGWIGGMWLMHFSNKKIRFVSQEESILSQAIVVDNCIKENLIYNTYFYDDVVYIVYN